MDYDVYKEMLDKVVKEPESAATCVVDTLEMLRKDFETFESVQNELEKYKEKVRNLQDTNTELFLRVSQPVNKNDKTLTDEDMVDRVMKSQFEGGNAKRG